MFGIKKGKQVDSKMLCSLYKFEEALDFIDEDLLEEVVYEVEEVEDSNDKLKSNVTFYSDDTDCNNLYNLNVATGHMFVQDRLEIRLCTILLQNEAK